MLHIALLPASLLALVFQATPLDLPRERLVDISASTLEWNASKVGGSHTGMVSISAGTLTVEKDMLLLADITMDMTSITCTDVTNPNSNGKLVSHLKNEDFFDVETHPKATFRTTSVERTGSAKGLATYRVSGVLTIKGVEQPNTFDVGMRKENDQHRATGTIRFDRTHYGIQYRSGSFFEGLGDRMIKDVVELKFDITAR